MSVCHAASIGIDQGVIEYTGPGGAHWRIPISEVRALGEYRSTENDRGTLIVILFDDSGTWLQAPCNAIGAEQLLHTLFERWGSIPIKRAPTSTGRVLWPPELADEPLLAETAKHLSARVAKWLEGAK